MSQLGATWVRAFVRWDQVEPGGPGRWMPDCAGEPRRADGHRAAARAQGRRGRDRRAAVGQRHDRPVRPAARPRGLPPVHELARRAHARHRRRLGDLERARRAGVLARARRPPVLRAAAEGRARGHRRRRPAGARARRRRRPATTTRSSRASTRTARATRSAASRSTRTPPAWSRRPTATTATRAGRIGRFSFLGFREIHDVLARNGHARPPDHHHRARLVGDEDPLRPRRLRRQEGRRRHRGPAGRQPQARLPLPELLPLRARRAVVQPARHLRGRHGDRPVRPAALRRLAPPGVRRAGADREVRRPRRGTAAATSRRPTSTSSSPGPTRVFDRFLDIKVVAHDHDSKLGRITLYANGSKIRSFTGDALANNRPVGIQWMGARNLPYGPVNVKVEALDEFGNTTYREVRRPPGRTRRRCPRSGRSSACGSRARASSAGCAAWSARRGAAFLPTGKVVIEWQYQRKGALGHAAQAQQERQPPVQLQRSVCARRAPGASSPGTPARSRSSRRAPSRSASAPADRARSSVSRRCEAVASMRLIVARCEVRYSGRLNAVLPEALRLLMIKSRRLGDGPRRHRRLQAAELDDAADRDRGGAPSGSSCASAPARPRTGSTSASPRCSRDVDARHGRGRRAREGRRRGATCRRRSPTRPQCCGEGFRLVRREWPTDIGPVDLMCRDDEDGWVAVEIKRIGDDRRGRAAHPLPRAHPPRPGDGRLPRRARRPADQAAGARRSPRRAGSRWVEVDLAVAARRARARPHAVRLARRQPRHERPDRRRVAQRRPVAEARDGRLELRQPPLARRGSAGCRT